jgi:hypothetical protein
MLPMSHSSADSVGETSQSASKVNSTIKHHILNPEYQGKRVGAPTLIFSSTVCVASHVLTKLAEVRMTVCARPLCKGHLTMKPVHEKNLVPFPTEVKFDH